MVENFVFRLCTVFDIGTAVVTDNNLSKFVISVSDIVRRQITNYKVTSLLMHLFVLVPIFKHRSGPAPKNKTVRWYKYVQISPSQ